MLFSLSHASSIFFIVSLLFAYYFLSPCLFLLLSIFSHLVSLPFNVCLHVSFCFLSLCLFLSFFPFSLSHLIFSHLVSHLPLIIVCLLVSFCFLSLSFSSLSIFSHFVCLLDLCILLFFFYFVSLPFIFSHLLSHLPIIIVSLLVSFSFLSFSLFLTLFSFFVSSYFLSTCLSSSPYHSLCMFFFSHSPSSFLLPCHYCLSACLILFSLILPVPFSLFLFTISSYFHSPCLSSSPYQCLSACFFSFLSVSLFLFLFSFSLTHFILYHIVYHPFFLSFSVYLYHFFSNDFASLF